MDQVARPEEVTETAPGGQSVAPWWAALRPPGFWRNAPWPPPLAEAEAALDGCGSGARSVGKYARRWLAYAASLATVGTEDALLRSYDLFRMIASYTADRDKWGSEMRTAALHNAAVVLSRLGAKDLIESAARQAADALDFFGDMTDAQLVGLVQGLTSTGAGLAEPVLLRWDGAFALVPVQPLGVPRIQAIPAAGLEGRWSGIQAGLLGYGLAAPDRPCRDRACQVVPNVDRLTVR